MSKRTKTPLKEMSNVDIHVGNKIKDLREARGWRHAFLAKVLDVSLQQVLKYENGANRVSASLLFQIANVFNVSTDHFFEGLPQTKLELGAANAELSAITAFARSHQGRELLAAFSEISDPKARRSILQFVRSMSS